MLGTLRAVTDGFHVGTMNNLLDCLIILAYVQIVFGIGAMLANPRSKINISLGFLCIGAGIWIKGIEWMQASLNFFWPDKIIFFGALLTVSCFYYFTSVFPKTLVGNEQNNFWKAVLTKYFLPQWLLLICLPFNLIVRSVHIVGMEIRPVNGPLFIPFAVVQLGYIFFAFKNMYRQFIRGTVASRQRVLYMFWGLVFFIFGGSVCDIILPALGYPTAKFIGPFCSLVFLIAVLLSIGAYQLMDIRIALVDLCSTIASALVAIFFLYTVLLLRHASGWMSDESWILQIVLSLAVFLFSRYLFEYIFHWLFLKRYDRFTEMVDQLNQILTSQTETRAIVHVVNSYLAKALNASVVCFYDYETSKFIFGPTVDPSIVSTISLMTIREIEHYAESSKLIMVEQPSQLFAIATIAEGSIIYGYVLLGNLQAFEFLGNEQIEVLERLFGHITTAYARAVLYESLRAKVQYQVKNITQQAKRLQELSKSKMDFVQMTSHQLRTPITVLNGALQLLLEDGIGLNDKRELISMAYEKSQQLARLVSEVLDLARIQKGVLDETSMQHAVALDTVFQNLIPVFEPRLAAKNLAFTYSKLGPISIIGNSMYLEQAFSNLLENAIDHTESGSISVHYNVEPEAIVVCIEDTGVGIQESVKDKLFSSKASSTKPNGVGMGLYIVDVIIRAHLYGHIWFESNQTGTIFYVRLKRLPEVIAKTNINLLAY